MMIRGVFVRRLAACLALLVIPGLAACDDSAVAPANEDVSVAPDNGSQDVPAAEEVLGPDAAGPTEDTAADLAGPDDTSALEDGGGPPDGSEPDASAPSCGDAVRPVGCACDSDDACLSGLCAPTREGGGVCAGACDGGCPAGLTCAAVARAGGEVVSLCVVRELDLCRPCRTDSDCRTGPQVADGDRCISRGPTEGSFCGMACEADADCPEGYGCAEATPVEGGTDVFQCVLRESNTACACSARAVAESAETDCAVAGRCVGVRGCADGVDGALGLCLDAEGGLCEPPTPVEVRFDPRGGAAVAPVTVMLGEPYGALPTTTRRGFDLAGWWLGADRITPETRVARREAHTLEAAWEGVAVAVAFDSAGGSACPPREVRFGAAYGALCEPVREGYAFAGWRLGEAPVTAGTLVETLEAHTLVATWTGRRYRVTFDTAGGAACASATVTFGAAYGADAPLCLPTRVGHAFGGWWLGEAAVTGETLVQTAADHTLVARWEALRYAVTFDAGPGTEPAPPGVTVLFGTPYGPLATSSRVGYALAGWWSGPDRAGVEVLPETVLARAENHTLYAGWSALRYVLTFDSAGGSPCPSQEVAFDAPYGVLCAPTRLGHRFSHWERAETGARVDAGTLVSAPQDDVLVARWTPERYRVTHDSAGGTPCEPREVVFAGVYGDLCSPTRVGYTFVGWYLGEQAVTADTEVATASHHGLVARWQARDYAVTFEPEGGELPTPPGLTATFDAPYGPLATTARLGYTFAGWWTEPGQDGAQVTPETRLVRAENHSLFARWQANRYRVSYDSQGGSACAPREVTFDAPYGEQCVPTRRGYDFGGWLLSPDGPDVAYAWTPVTTPTDHTVHARWLARLIPVQLDLAGGEGCDARTVRFGSPYALGCTPSRAGHTFLGWYLGADDAATPIGESTVVDTEGPHTLVARWRANAYTVNFDAANGTGCSAPATVTFGAPYGEAVACVPTYPGYAFEGWFLAPVGGAARITPDSIFNRFDHMLYARWKYATYTVTFDGGGGTGCDTTTVTYRGSYTAVLACVPTRAGYTFRGWAFAPNGYAISDTSQVLKTSDHAVYALWQANTYRVDFDNQGGTLCAPRFVTFGASYQPISLCTTTRVGYTFGGWQVEDDVLSPAITPETLVATPRDHILRARWTARQYRVTYLGLAGGACPDATVTYGSPYGEVAGSACAVTRVGYTFAGWRIGSSNGPEATPATIVANVDHWLWATWTPNVYALTYDAAGGTACAGRAVTFASPYGALCAPTRLGHTFAGWRLTDGTTVSDTTTVSTPSAHTLTALWTANRYTVTLGWTCPSVTVTWGGTYGGASGALCTPEREGYTFTGWFFSPELGGAPVTATTPVTLLENHVLEARWEVKSYTVSFDSLGGTACAGRTVVFDEPYGAAGGDFCVPTREGYAFGGWFFSPNGFIQATPETLVATGSDHTLYARWTARRFTVTFNSMGGSACSPLTVTYGASYSGGTPLCLPTRDGYSHAGWYTGPDGGARILSTTLVTTASDHTLHALWTPWTVTVRFNAEGGSTCAPTSFTTRFNDPLGAALDACLPTRAGYSFGGWFTGRSGFGTRVTRDTLYTWVTLSRDIYAYWVAL